MSLHKIKKYILDKLGITDLKKKNKNDRKKIEDLEKNYKLLLQRNAELEAKIDSLSQVVFQHHKGLNQKDRNPRIILSLTSFPERAPYVPQILERMLMQTVRPDKVILWLSKEQFPNLEEDLPATLLNMKAYGVEIKWCDGDIKAYKKFIPALKEYPDDLIVIIDDDMVFDADFIEKMYEAHLMFPEHIIASRVHQIGFDEEGKIAPYSKWKKECNYDKYQVRDDWFLTGGAGTLFPPNCFGKDIFDEEVLARICPHADDIWLNIHAAISGKKIVNIATNKHLPAVKGTQVKRLWDINMKQNDVQLKAMVEHYKEQLRDSVYDVVL